MYFQPRHRTLRQRETELLRGERKSTTGFQEQHFTEEKEIPFTELFNT